MFSNCDVAPQCCHRNFFHWLHLTIAFLDNTNLTNEIGAFSRNYTKKLEPIGEKLSRIATSSLYNVLDNANFFPQSFFSEFKDSFPTPTSGDEIPIQIEVCCKTTKYILLNCRAQMK